MYWKIYKNIIQTNVIQTNVIQTNVIQTNVILMKDSLDSLTARSLSGNSFIDFRISTRFNPCTHNVLSNGQQYFKNLVVFTSQDFFKYVWTFYNIMHERIKEHSFQTSFIFEIISSSLSKAVFNLSSSTFVLNLPRSITQRITDAATSGVL